MFVILATSLLVATGLPGDPAGGQVAPTTKLIGTLTNAINPDACFDAGAGGTLTGAQGEEGVFPLCAGSLTLDATLDGDAFEGTLNGNWLPVRDVSDVGTAQLAICSASAAGTSATGTWDEATGALELKATIDVGISLQKEAGELTGRCKPADAQCASTGNVLDLSTPSPTPGTVARIEGPAVFSPWTSPSPPNTITFEVDAGALVIPNCTWETDEPGAALTTKTDPPVTIDSPFTQSIPIGDPPVDVVIQDALCVLVGSAAPCPFIPDLLRGAGLDFSGPGTAVLEFSLQTEVITQPVEPTGGTGSAQPVPGAQAVAATPRTTG